jgi:hypothetical protein
MGTHPQPSDNLTVDLDGHRIPRIPGFEDPHYRLMPGIQQQNTGQSTRRGPIRWKGIP